MLGRIDLRKFIFSICLIFSIFLFSFGVIVVGFLDEGSSDTGASSPNPISNLIAPYLKITKPVNILCTVSDQSGLRTDTIILVNYDPATAKLNMISIPRDTKVLINGHINKINAAYVYGKTQLTVDTVSNLLGVNIQYYVSINISVMRNIVDLLGGVDFNVPIDMNYDDKSQNLHIHLKKGKQHLNGKKVEELLRYRKPNHGAYTSEILKYYDGSDINRTSTQLKFVKALVKQKANATYLSKLGSILNEIFSKIKTNLTTDKITNLASNASNIKSDNITAFKIYGAARTENGISYYIFNNSAINIETNAVISSEDLISKYFHTGRSEHYNSEINANFRTQLDYNNANYHAATPTKKPTITPTKKSTHTPTPKPSTVPTHTPTSTPKPTNTPIPTDTPKPTDPIDTVTPTPTDTTGTTNPTP